MIVGCGFRKHGISYYNPQLPEWSTHYIPLEAAIKDKCRVLLYVITDDTRGITSMLEVCVWDGLGVHQIIKGGVTILFLLMIVDIIFIFFKTVFICVGWSLSRTELQCSVVYPGSL